MFWKWEVAQRDPVGHCGHDREERDGAGQPGDEGRHAGQDLLLLLKCCSLSFEETGGRRGVNTPFFTSAHSFDTSPTWPCLVIFYVVRVHRLLPSHIVNPSRAGTMGLLFLGTLPGHCQLPTTHLLAPRTSSQFQCCSLWSEESVSTTCWGTQPPALPLWDFPTT